VSILRLSRPEDAGALKEIWNASFPGDEAFADWFLKAVYRPENALLWEDGGRARAMLHLMPMNVKIGGRDEPAAYVYAVATLPESRGKGAASALLTEAEAVSKARGAKLLMLVPQSESLFEYYRRQGFIGALFRARRVIRAGTGEIPPGLELDDAPGTGELNACFEAALPERDHVTRTEAHWGHALNYLHALGVRRDGKLAGYAVYDDEGVVRELIASDEAARRILEAGALGRMGVPEAIAFSPDGPDKPYGMARAIEPGFELKGAYAGLMLD
jgi:ribosomal protein S18 acetylase RimI-like enzyme